MTTTWIISIFASSFGIGIGGGIAWIMNGFQRAYGFIYAFCAGLIIGLLALEMIPESIELGGLVILIVGFSIGVILFQYIHRLMGKITIITASHQKDIFVRTGVLLTLSIAIHNFPVGIALGQTLGTEMGNLILTTLVLHNIPEGIIVFTPLFLAGFGILTFVFITVFITFPIALGTLLGQLFNSEFSSLLAFIINLSIAIIFMVATKDIFAEAVRNSSLLYSFVIGIFGLGVIYLYIISL